MIFTIELLNMLNTYLTANIYCFKNNFKMRTSQLCGLTKVYTLSIKYWVIKYETVLFYLMMGVEAPMVLYIYLHYHFAHANVDVSFSLPIRILIEIKVTICRSAESNLFSAGLSQLSDINSRTLENLTRLFCYKSPESIRKIMLFVKQTITFEANGVLRILESSISLW